jgi:hypothetical protein
MVNPNEFARNPAIARALPTQNSIESHPVSRAAGAVAAARAVMISPRKWT